MSHFSHLPPADYEKHDVNAGPIGRSSVVIAVLTVLAVVVAWIYFRGLEQQELEARRAAAPVVVHPPDRQAPEPRLQPAPFDDVKSLRQEERELLGGYGFVDAQAGVTRIPVEEAMRIYVERAAAGRAAHPFATPALAPAAEAQR
jgi:hypothetical protein